MPLLKRRYRKEVSDCPGGQTAPTYHPPPPSHWGPTPRCATHPAGIPAPTWELCCRTPQLSWASPPQTPHFITAPPPMTWVSCFWLKDPPKLPLPMALSCSEPETLIAGRGPGGSGFHSHLSTLLTLLSQPPGTARGSDCSRLAPLDQVLPPAKTIPAPLSLHNAQG